MFTLGGFVPDGLHEEHVLGEHGHVVRVSWLQHQSGLIYLASDKLSVQKASSVQH